MKESRVFELNQVTAEQVLEAVTTFLRGEKGMEVQSVATPNGYLIQAAQADTLRTLSGMKLATTVELTVNGTQLNVTLGEGQWADKLGAGAVGLFLLWPLAINAAQMVLESLGTVVALVAGLFMQLALSTYRTAASTAFYVTVSRDPRPEAQEPSVGGDEG